MFKVKNEFNKAKHAAQNAAQSITTTLSKDKASEIQSRRGAAQEQVNAHQNEQSTPEPIAAVEETVNIAFIEEQLERERLLREKKAEAERLRAERPQSGHEHSASFSQDEDIKEEKKDALVTTVHTGTSQLSEEDQPRFTLFSSKSVMMKRDEGFMFCVDVNAGYFHITVENSQRSALEALTKLGQEPTLYVRVRVIDPRPWSQMFVKSFTLRSQRDSRLDWVFSVNRSSTLQVIVVHNGALQATGMMKTCHMSINVLSCFPADFVSFHRGNGVKKTQEVQELMDAADTIKPQYIEPVPYQLALQLQDKHSFTATGIGEDVLIFGGCRLDGTFTNQLMMLDCCTNKLGEFGDLLSKKLIAGGNKFVYTGLRPRPRAGHSACVFAGKVIYFGGFGANKDTLSDMHFFHIVERAWSSPDALRATPMEKDPALCTLGRGFHSAVVHEQHMYVYGGCSDFDAAIAQRYYHMVIPASVLWRYDFQDRSWTDLGSSLKGTMPHNGGLVYGHCAAVVSDGMYVCGGAEMELYTGSQQQQNAQGHRPRLSRCDEVYHFCFSSNTWTTYKTTGIGPLFVPFAAMWGFDSQPQQSLQHSWPIPQVHAKPNKFEKRLAHLKALVMFGGQAAGPTCEAVYILPLHGFRNHLKLEWFSLDTEGAADDGTILVPEILRDCEEENRTSLINLPRQVFFSMPKALLADAPKTGGGPAGNGERAEKSEKTSDDVQLTRANKNTFGAFVRIPRTMILDIPKVALFDLPRDLLYELPKAAIESMKEDVVVEPDPPGAHTIICTQGKLHVINFGVRISGPGRPDKEKKDANRDRPGDTQKEKDKMPHLDSDVAPIFLLPDIIPQDFVGEFSTCTAEDDNEALEEDAIAKAFSEYEQSLATLSAQKEVAQRLSIAEPRCDYQEAFLDAAADLKRLIKRCNILLLKLPNDAFGDKGRDLMELFQVLQLQAEGLFQAAEAHEEHEVNEEISEGVVSPANAHHGLSKPTPGKMSKIFRFPRHKKSVPSTEEHPGIPHSASTHSSISETSTEPPAHHSDNDPPATQTVAEPSVDALKPRPSVAVPGGRPHIDFVGLPKEVRHFVELVDSIESQLTCVESYSSAVAGGHIEFRNTLQEESDLLVSYLRSAQEKVTDVPATIYSTDAGRAQSQQAEGVVNHFYTQLARAENLLGADAIRGIPEPSKLRAERPWQGTKSSILLARRTSLVFPLPSNVQSIPSSITSESPSTSSTISSPTLHSMAMSSANHTTASISLERLDRTPHAIEWRARFKLPTEESLLNDFTCALKGKALKQGRLYVSKNHICFYSSAGHMSQVIKLVEVANIQKKTSAGFLNNSMEVILRSNEKVFFTNFAARDTAYQLIFSLWQSALLMS